MKLFLTLLLIIGVTFSGASIAEEDSGQGLLPLLKQTYLNNPSLQAARAELRAVHESLPQAQAGWKPDVRARAGINAADIDGSNFGGAEGATEKNIGIGLTQPLYKGGRTLAATDAARAQIQAARFNLLQVEQEILSQSVAAYMDVIRDQGLLDLSTQNMDVLSEQLKATQERFEVGELTRTDVSQAEARLSRAEADRITAQGAVRASRATYIRLIGQEPSEGLSAPDISLELPGTLEEAIKTAEDIAPQILRAESLHKESEERVGVVFGELLPSVDLSLDWGRSYDPQPGSNDESTTKSAGVAADIPLYQSGAVLSRVREAKQNANRSYIQILEARRSVREDVIRAWENLDTARAEIRAREKQVDAASIAREGVYQEEQVGIRTILDTLDADQELLDAEVSLITAQRNEIVSMFDMAAVLGLLTPEYLGFPDAEIDYDSHLKKVSSSLYSLSIE